MRLDGSALPRTIKTSVPDGTKLQEAEVDGLGLNRVQTSNPDNIRIANNPFGGSGIKIDGHTLPGFKSPGITESHQAEILKVKSSGSQTMNIQGANSKLQQIDVHLKGGDKLNVGVGRAGTDSETTIHAEGKNDITINPQKGDWSMYKISQSRDDSIKVEGQESPIKAAESGNTGIVVSPDGKAESFDLNKQDFDKETGKVRDLEGWEVESREFNPPVLDSDDTAGA